VSKCCVILFLKNPARTPVKSRLGAALGSKAAQSLYRCFVADILETLEKGLWPLIIAFYPSDAGEEMESWLGNGYTFTSQHGDGLGERMKNAFMEAFSRGFQGALLIGSDIPDLPNRILDEACASLEKSGTVIGPALDGGYYLIGFRHDTFTPHVFDGVDWSTPDVFKQTMAALKKAGRRVHELPRWSDVDTYDDLEMLFSRSEGTPFAESTTMEYLRKMKGGHGEPI
jgi:uncharacterized protein